MRIADILWTDWNIAHITGHGGSKDVAEAVLMAPGALIQVTAARTAKARAVVVARDWTVVFSFEPLAGDAVLAYPITMYPTKRGSRRRRTP